MDHSDIQHMVDVPFYAAQADEVAFAGELADLDVTAATTLAEIEELAKSL